MNNVLLSMIGWTLVAAILGFAISAVFSGWLRFSRTRFLIPYVCLTCIFLYGFVLVNEVNLVAVLRENWAWGILAGGLVSIFLVKTVRSQPLSRQSNGAGVVFDLLWAGLVYGMVDALFLNVMPVLAVWIGTSQFDWAGTVAGKIAVSAAGLFASILVTLTYHLGYPEFRNKRVMLVLAGNSLITLAFLLSGSPWGSIISHTAMHVAAVLQGAETTIQLPPHYQKKLEAQ
ncbi:hypothetical protein FBQ99_22180 [Chloroflexi bacterium CFX2]|nr:hypothetical protein [Chloroflexi bacterium CFX2]